MRIQQAINLLRADLLYLNRKKLNQRLFVNGIGTDTIVQPFQDANDPDAYGITIGTTVVNPLTEDSFQRNIHLISKELEFDVRAGFTRTHLIDFAWTHEETNFPHAFRVGDTVGFGFRPSGSQYFTVRGRPNEDFEGVFTSITEVPNMLDDDPEFRGIVFLDNYPPDPVTGHWFVRGETGLQFVWIEEYNQWIESPYKKVVWPTLGLGTFIEVNGEFLVWDVRRRGGAAPDGSPIAPTDVTWWWPDDNLSLLVRLPIEVQAIAASEIASFIADGWFEPFTDFEVFDPLAESIAGNVYEYGFNNFWLCQVTGMYDAPNANTYVYVTFNEEGLKETILESLEVELNEIEDRFTKIEDELVRLNSGFSHEPIVIP